MKKYFIFVVVSILVLISSMIFAGSSGSGMISNIEFIGNGEVLFKHNGIRSGAPDCVGANFNGRWAFDATTAGGKVQLSGLLTAYASGKKVTIIGANDCSVWGDTESVSYFYTNG